MDALIISFLLLLPCFASFFECEGTVLKTTGNEPDFIPICSNETSNIIALIVCRIRTERNKEEECHLLYIDEGDFVHECDSRFTLKTWNDTVFLHLTSLTAADNGNFTCECSKLDGTYILHLNITVKDNGEDDIWEVWSHSSRGILPSALTAAVIFILLVILGFFCRRCYNREQPESRTYSPNEDLVVVEPYSSFIQKENGEENSSELYRSLQQPTRDLYQTVPSGHHQQETERTTASNRVTVNRNYEIYENL